jgi:hypothetical protein
MTASAGHLQWNRNTTHLDVTGQYKDFGDGFRADTGFIPQVGYRETYGETGWTVRPKGFLSRLRTFVIADQQRDRQGELIFRQVSPGAGMDARWNSFFRVRYASDHVRSGEQLFHRQLVLYTVQSSPSRRVTRVAADGFIGQEIDFANSRRGHGATINLSATVNPTDHLEVTFTQNQRWLNVNAEGLDRHLFTARVSRVRGAYTFTPQLFARVIGQYVSTDLDPALYIASVTPRSGTFSASALLAYKLNWQSVLFVGYGDDRELSTLNELERADRQFFVKISYAFQR